MIDAIVELPGMLDMFMQALLEGLFTGSEGLGMLQ